MSKKFEMNQTKIKCGCQSGRKVVTHDSMSGFRASLASLAATSLAPDRSTQSSNPANGYDFFIRNWK